MNYFDTQADTVLPHPMFPFPAIINTLTDK